MARRFEFSSVRPYLISISHQELPMPYLLLFLILGYPLAEIFAIFKLAEAIGGALTLFWLIGAFVLGMLMLRHHKLAVVATLFGDLRAGTITPGSLLRLARYYLAAVLLIIPGPVSDIAALLLLLPWGRGHAPARPIDQDGVIEGDYRRVDPDPNDKLIK